MLPTYEECLKIVKNSEVFYMKEEFFMNKKIHIFSYRLSTYNDFKINNAFELRGLTFIYNEISKNWDRFIALNKFFNINENEDWLLEKFNKKKITKIEEKIDGSMISFVLINEKIYAKTKLTFISSQAIAAQKIIDNDINLFSFIYGLIKSDLMPIFEYISPFNQIVLEYEKTELILLQVRCNVSGEYLNLKDLNTYDIKIKKSFENYSLNDLMKLKESKKEIEGYVITFKDGSMAKVKTDWYMELHHIIGDDIMVENIIIRNILEEKIDDVLSQLSLVSEKRKFILGVQDKVDNYFNSSISYIEKIVQIYFKEYDNKKNINDFVKKYNKTELFRIIMKKVRRYDEINVEERLKEQILKETFKLENARNFLKKINPY